MGDKTGIEWTEATWNPIVGCSVVSPGCTNCYAMKMAGTRLAHTDRYQGLTQESKAGPVWTGELRLVEKALDQPLRWKKPRRIFVNSMSDLFHENVEDEWIACIFAVMALCPQHTFQILTKRPGRMQAYLSDKLHAAQIWDIADRIAIRLNLPENHPGIVEFLNGGLPSILRPLPNVWLGTSAEDQKRLDLRGPELMRTPAARRFLSLEPCLGDMDLTPYVLPPSEWSTGHLNEYAYTLPERPVDWVIVGGESGPGARPMHPAWARSLRDQCVAAGVPFLFKQWGSWAHLPERAHFKECFREAWRRVSSDLDGVRPALMFEVGKKKAGRLLDGRLWDEYPESAS